MGVQILTSRRAKTNGEATSLLGYTYSASLFTSHSTRNAQAHHVRQLRLVLLREEEEEDPSLLPELCVF